MYPCRFLLLVCLVFFSRAGAAPYKYDFNDNCNKAYQHLMALHLREANSTIVAELKTNPGNLVATYLSDYEDCIVLLLNSDPAEYKARERHLETRIAELDKGDKSSPWYRFCKSGIYLHWAIINIRLGNNYKAAMNFRRSFALLRENQQLFPSFEYNSIFGGLQEAVVGSLPGNYKWLASVFGIKGDVRKGAARLGAFLSSHSSNQPLYTETALYYLYVRFYLLSEQKEVWNFLNSTQFSTRDNMLNTFAKVNIALDFHRADAAIQTLRALPGEAYTSYPVFSHQMGVALLTRCDTSCVSWFQAFLNGNKSGSYIKDAWQKMAFAWYVHGNTTRAAACLAQVTEQGSARLDADKQAQRFADADAWPVQQLLRARLLTDGGYNKDALQVLQSIHESTLTSAADRSEYHFRLARVYQEMAWDDKAGASEQHITALRHYRHAINAGSGRHEQYAARAALQMGKMYEYLGMKKEAVTAFNECLEMPAHDFQNSIDQQAKAGLNRLQANN